MEEAQLAPEPSRNGLVTAQHARLEFALVEAKDLDSLKELESQAAAVQAYVQRLDEASEELHRIGEFRIRVAREIGLLLQATVRRGGDRAKSHDVSLPRDGGRSGLPRGISPMQSSRYQRLARIPDHEMQRYFAECRAKGRLASAAGLVRHVARQSQPAGRGGTRRPPRRGVGGGLGEVWDATKRLIDNVDVAIGIPPCLVGATRKTGDPSAPDVGGRVAGSLDDGVDAWLATLLDRSRVLELVLVLPADASAPWFTTVAAAECSVCFLSQLRSAGLGRMVVYHGERRHGFWLAFRDLGGVWKGERY